jgi:hypothetical protein
VLRLRITERPKGYRLCPMHPHKCTLILGAVRDQHQRGRLRYHREEPGEHRLADLVNPVRVLDNKDRRFGAGQRRGIDQRRQPPPPRIRVDLRQLHIGIGDAHQVVKQQQVLRLRIGSHIAHPVAGSPRVQTFDAGSRPQQACDSMKRGPDRCATRRRR